MKAYVFCFIISILLVMVADNCFKKNKKTTGIIFLMLSLFTVCYIAGLRNIDVGADVKNYTLTLFKLYSENNYNFFQVTTSTKIEPLFSLLICVSSVFKNINVCLFFIEFACALPIYLFAYKERENYSLAFIIFIFLITMYARSFNLMRQFIAISVIVYSISFFKRKKYIKTLALYIVAILFHYSAVTCALIYFIIYIAEIRENKQNRKILLFLLITFTIIFVVYIDKILVILPNKYSAYLNSEYAINVFSIASFIKKIFWIVISIILLYQSRKDSDKYSNQLQIFLLLLIDIILYFSSMKVGTFGRLGNYFLYVAYFYMIPIIQNAFKQRHFVNCIIIIILCLFWYNMTVISYDVDKTYPYVSDILEVLND